ncbi:hypothetical protein MHZ95_11460 [Sporosarcina sp. ACRSM]|uniref:hypothetical protein n=1 Tax=Sporosarcina sp. ACRSM TaxID=2918216 RepID=UPI001EF74B76|nr:hypothetical protein [Sporosarcina sp. ACRSM]MCG7335898.1 hypothetical protein [Sporosarcina sp. ACRSM]
MKKRKQNRDWKRIGYELLAFAFFVFLLYIIFVNWQRNEEVKEAQKSNPTVAIVYDKTAEKHLFSGISYIVLLKPGLVDKTISKLSTGDWATVAKAEFEALEIGDTIDGYSIQGVFHTQNELETDSKWFYIVLCIVGIYPFGYICYWLLKIKKVQAFITRYDFGLGIVMNIILGAGLLFLLLFMFREMIADLKNGHEKYFGDHHIETTAMVTDNHREHRGSRRAPTYYYLAIAFEDENGRLYHVTKEVKYHTYRTYKDDVLAISFKKEDPYTVYVQQPFARDVFNFLLSRDFFMYCLMIILTALIGYTFFLLNRKRRTGSYLHSAEDSQLSR